ncbi:glycoside hydrolase family 5 protein [Backusella circina FSU 941]|nr:glycoside hydrolase family 5 protein [Backusella circina FSU 941]
MVVLNEALSSLEDTHHEAAQDLATAIDHKGQYFKDSYGRTLLMRGINVCGSSKLPTFPYAGSTHLYDETLFWDHRNVSFVNRPFSLKDAPEHLSRLRAWGLTLIRLIVTWEALEHEGPGIYDESYIDYLVELIKLLPSYGMKCIIDPHQDTWSRFSGGSGAPGWTFEVAGMNMKHFKETGAAYVHNTNAVPGDPLPMVWPTNYTKLACCTMFTLFFGGDIFAPRRLYNGKPVQQVLNDCFVDCFQHLAKRLVHLDAVIGFEFMNEPSAGYIGMESLEEFDPISNLIFGDAPKPLQSFALGDGMDQTVGVHVKSWPFPTKKSHDRIINPDHLSAWSDKEGCVWRQHGVWKLDDNNANPVLADPAYFSKHPVSGKKVSFYRDCYMPLVNRYNKAIQSVKPEWYCLVEPLANERAPVYTEEDHHHNVVFAPHWYDLNCVFYKSFNGKVTHDVQSLQRGGNVFGATYFGQNGAKKNYRGQLKNIKQDGLADMGNKPMILGEVGIPMDLNERYAFLNDDYTHHVKFMDAVIHALETNLINFVLWNYDVCNDHEFGDHWNGENFSIYSVKKATEDYLEHNDGNDKLSKVHLYDGGRVLEAVLRPYACKIAGIPTQAEFNLNTLEYTFSFMPNYNNDNDDKRCITTEIFVPAYHYGQTPLDVQVTSGTWDYNKENQTLYHYLDGTQDAVTIQLRVLDDLSKSSSSCLIM